jgi:hypothetical protein
MKLPDSFTSVARRFAGRLRPLRSRFLMSTANRQERRATRRADHFTLAPLNNGNRWCEVGTRAFRPQQSARFSKPEQSLEGCQLYGSRSSSNPRVGRV